MPRSPVTGLTIHGVVVAFLLSASLHARTWTDTQGRTIEADYLGATTSEVSLRRSDGRRFTLPLTLLSPADRDFVARQISGETAAPALDFNELNTLFGLPLFDDLILWDDEPAAVALRLNLPLEGKTDRFEGYRGYAREPFPLLGTKAHMISLQAAEGRITTITVQFTNRGDHPPFKSDDTRFYPSKDQLKEFEQALKHDFETLTAALTGKLGEPKREIAIGGLDPGRRSLRWEWGAHAFLASHDAEQMVSLKILPAERAAPTRLADDQVRRLFKERIKRRTTGDVILDQIPMVNQGPKGYCVPATFERYLRYAGIPADMYELAACGGTDFGGGTSFAAMTRSLDRFVRRQGRRLEKIPVKLNVAGIARYIDEGRPVIWGLYSTEAFNALANRNTEARQVSTELFNLKRTLTAAELDALQPESQTGHACLIIGYNRTTNEVAISDSWGSGFKERWVPIQAAQKVTQDEYWVLAW